ncbi:MAG: hypothetical protein JW995_05835 [Melioribacteraceae bacterium]|nr:hypothetical protein [Melioribacteraceae bacterium]
MIKLSFDTFIGAAQDIELSQYKLLAAIQYYSDLLHRNKLYPSFGELVQVFKNVNQLKKQKSEIDNFARRMIKGIDLKKKELIYESEKLDDKDSNRVFEFIEWALPKLKEILDEGKAIFDFVDENIHLKEVGIIPLYKNEGYFVIDNSDNNCVEVFRYEMYLISADDEHLRTLKSNLIESRISENVGRLSLDELKLMLINRYPDLPNPALYKFESEIEFPFTETVLPVAKRKLMQKLAA